MKTHILHIFIFFSVSNIYAQKRPLTINDLKQWPGISNEMISADGRYISYEIKDASSYGSQNSAARSQDKLIIESSDKSWKKEFIGATELHFLPKNNQAIFKFSIDTICIIEAGKSAVDLIPCKSPFRLDLLGQSDYISCLTAGKSLILINAGHKNEIDTLFRHVSTYLFNDLQNVLTILTDSLEDNNSKQTLYSYDLKTKVKKLIWKGFHARKFAFDNSGNKLGFIADDPASNGQNAIWEYGKTASSALPLVTNNTPGIKACFTIADEQFQFCPDGRAILFSLTEATTTPNMSLDSLTASQRTINSPMVWSYRDYYFPTEREMLEKHKKLDYEAFKHEGSDTTIVFFRNYYQKIVVPKTGHYLIYIPPHNEDTEPNPLLKIEPSVRLISTEDGSIKTIVDKKLIDQVSMSPTGRYVIWFDRSARNYFSYNTTTGQTTNITNGVKSILYDEQFDKPRQAPYFAYPNSPCEWTGNDRYLFVYDQFDIWQVDPNGIVPPVNITNGYGRRHNTVLRLFDTGKIAQNQRIYLKAFNIRSKFSGFFSTGYPSTADPVKLTMGPYVYDLPLFYPPIKAKDTSVFLIRRLATNSFSNLFLTKDYKTFQAATNLQPQKKFVWLSSELVRWKMPNGKEAEGILFKPDNFDARKKYPVIFYYYEKLADELKVNNYLTPKLSNGTLNIPFFVSNGYLVFVPNIYYTTGHPTESVCNSVISAARFLDSKTWIDKRRLGLQGISFGGYETNILVTHSKIFAAAAESSGLCDLLGDYGSYRPSAGWSNDWFYEYDQFRMGTTPWQRRDLYIQNSPIFYADRVSTPILIMHNQGDGVVPWAQGLEWFTALRRLDKTAWMLDYGPNEGHGISGDEDKQDFTIRLKQFFDHYLKNAPAPAWMTEHISRNLSTVSEEQQDTK